MDGADPLHSADSRAVTGERDVVLPAVAALPVAPTATVGREQELVAVARLLGDPDCRLVTLTGPGGVGKTRLARAVADAIRSSFADGVCWVELAGAGPLRDGRVGTSPTSGRQPVIRRGGRVRRLGINRRAVHIDG